MQNTEKHFIVVVFLLSFEYQQYLKPKPATGVFIKCLLSDLN